MKSIFIWGMLIGLLSCSKSQPDEAMITKAGSLEGKWQIAEIRADPGDGSGRFIPANQQFSVSFTKDGKYHDTRDDVYNRYTMIATDTVKLYHTDKPAMKLLAIKEIGSNTLIYYTNWPWCGGPYGEKFTRVTAGE